MKTQLSVFCGFHVNYLNNHLVIYWLVDHLIAVSMWHLSQLDEFSVPFMCTFLKLTKYLDRYGRYFLKNFISEFWKNSNKSNDISQIFTNVTLFSWSSVGVSRFLQHVWQSPKFKSPVADRNIFWHLVHSPVSPPVEKN